MDSYKEPGEWHLLHINIQCLANKVNMLQLFVHDINPIFLCISEHWLTEEKINLVYIQGYKIISSHCRKSHIHGGTAVFVKNENKYINNCKSIQTVNNLSVDLSFECSSICYNKNSCIVVLYRSPNGDYNIFIRQLTMLLQIVTKKYTSIYICGDLNINKLKRSVENSILHDLLESFDLTSLINEPTRIAGSALGISKTAVDYLITNQTNVKVKVTDPGISDHSAQVLSSNFEEHSNREYREPTTSRRSFSHNNIENFKYTFKGAHLDLLRNFDSISNIDEFFDIFWSHFEYSFETAFKKSNFHNKKLTRNAKEKKFIFSQKLKEESLNLKNLNYLRKQINNENLNTLYKTKKNQYQQNLKKEKQLYNKNKIEMSANKTKTLWNIVNANLNRSKQTKENIKLNWNDTVVTENKEVANVFANHFSKNIEIKLESHFPNISNTCTTTNCNNMNTIFFNPVTVQEVKDAILELANKKSTGIDEVPVKLIKECVDEFAACLALIINKSVELGVFPQKLKTALIIPVFKKGDSNDIKNYRPISLLSVFSKIIEKTMAKRITDFLEKYHILTNSQHGFRGCLSTETATTDLIQTIYERMDSKEYIMGLFFDLSSAFDTLHIPFVADKLEKLGIRGNVNDWLISYLTNRRLLVKIGDIISDRYEVSMGTPQGSVLGPLIFLLFINDLPEFIKYGKVFMYADDTSIIVSSRSLEELEKLVNTVLGQFNSWCYKNRLIINYDKTVCVLFRTQNKNIYKSINISLNSRQLSIQKDTNFLGVILDENLGWTKYIDQLCAKLSKSCFAIVMLKNSLDQTSLINVYYALFYSKISYNIIAWGQSVDIQRVFVMQKRVLRVIFNMRNMESCRDTFKKNNLLTVTSIYLYKLFIYMYGIKNKLPAHCDNHEHNTRNRNNIYINKYNLTLYKKSPLCAGSFLFNKLPSDIKETNNIKQFKAKIFKLLCSKCFYSVGEYINQI